MTDSVSKRLLKDGIYFLYRDGHITVTTKTETEAYIDEIDDYHILDLGFFDFDQDLSENCTFNTTIQTITPTNPAVVQRLVTRELDELFDSKIKGLHVLATEKDGCTFQLSTDGGFTFYNITDYNPQNGQCPATPASGALVPEDIRLQISFTGANSFSRFMVAYLKTDN